MKIVLRAMIVTLALALVLPSDVSAFSGSVNQGSKSKSIPKLSKKHARILAKIGQGALARQIAKAKKAKAAKALIAKAMKLIKQHEAKAKAAAKAKGKKRGAFGR